MTNASLRLFVVTAVMLTPAVAYCAVTLTAKDLYGGFDARKVLLNETAGKLTLDPRAVKVKQPGIIVTDPIDLGPRKDLVSTVADVRAVAVAVTADVPDGATAVVELRSGADMFETAKWSEWTKLAGLTGRVEKLAGRYVQVRITLTGPSADKMPAVSTVELSPTVAPAPGPALPPIAVSKSNIQKIVRSPIAFVYERPDAPEDRGVPQGSQAGRGAQGRQRPQGRFREAG